MIKYAAILCAGKGIRANLGYNKTLFSIGQRSILEMNLEKFSGFDRIVVVANPSDIDEVAKIAQNYGAEVITGGQTRTDSAKAAIFHLFNSGESDAIVAIHDGARPYVTRNLIDKTIEAANEWGSGVAAVSVIDSLKRAEGFVVTESIERDNLFAMQTPQAFRLGEIFSAYATADGVYSDDGEVYRSAGYELTLVEGEYSNKKLTVPEDFASITQAQSVGVGFDVHALAKKRRLILGGIKIDYKKGLLGHSDADVLLHAISDAILSAAGERDIGNLFPQSRQNLDLNSEVILKTAHESLIKSNQKIDFISAVIIAQKPKLANYIPKMCENIAKILKIDLKQINISATTTEFLGIIGRGRAIAASANCLTSKI